ncbi:murein biosynthesis integral membrane protein MurJ [Prochlorothrix hollandica]|uniref:murein biosynthesis integral membrane protein MurJ n=1 Tax=Prochlorothrix hollandica TaxID=1223 RepID=UPI000345104C|nr:murein biosynthesis integral membrane protein MurJ [Prochlorothrix hollandica]
MNQGDSEDQDPSFGDSSPGDSSPGDSSPGDSSPGDSSFGDSSTGDPSTGDPSFGDSSTGDSSPGNSGVTQSPTDPSLPVPPSPARSLGAIAGIVAAATLLSKVFGLVRQQAIAAAFGTGVAFDAFNYAYVVPGFLLILLGGINGPFHSAIVSVLSKQNQKDAAPLVETITTVVGLLLLGLTALIILFANPLISLVAPGLGTTAAGAVTHAIAVQQLQIMAPMALLAGFIGIGFGTLSAADHYWLPSISPLFSSVTVLLGLGGLWMALGQDLLSPEYAAVGGMVLAGSTLVGAVLQWLVQLPPQMKAGYGGFRFRLDWNRPGVREVFKIMAPATFSSGTLQINVYTDLFFASYIPQAAAALGYAGLLAMTPLGILSNVILVPLMPVFSRLAAPENWGDLKQRIRQGLLLSASAMLPTGALIMALNRPIVRLVYERGAFHSESSEIVASLLLAYGLGLFVYLGRDVIVRVFYALGDGTTPFYVSLFNILLNGVLDYVCVKHFGAPGLVFATVGVNLFTLCWLTGILHRRLGGLPLLEWGWAIAGLSGSSAVGAGLAAVLWTGISGSLASDSLGAQILALTVAGAGGLAAFTALALRLRIPEVQLFLSQITRKLKR